MIRKILRRVLGRTLFGNLLRVINYITLPKAIKREASAQAIIDKATKEFTQEIDEIATTKEEEIMTV